MARIAPFDLSQAPDAFRALVRDPGPQNLYRMLAHAGPSAVGFLQLGNALRDDIALDPRLREIATLRVGFLCNAQYEIKQHRKIAMKAGLSVAKIAALGRDADASALDELERFVLDFTDEVVQHVKVSDATFAEAVVRFTPRAIAELVLTIGFYLMTCRILENFEVDLEP